MSGPTGVRCEHLPHRYGPPLITYTIEVFGPDPDFIRYGALGRAMGETEENLNDLLSPEKYRVRIREWDEEEKPA